MAGPDSLQQIGRTDVRWKNRVYAYFGGCDYFRLASHASVKAALRTGLNDYGLNVAASRLTTGNHEVYGKLEAALAKFFDAPAAVVTGNGYATNAIVAQALRGSFSRVIMDELAHGSLQDASRQFDCRVVKFKHRDAGDLARILARGGGADKPIVLTDGVLAQTGAVAPLAKYAELLPPHGMILVDDAHGAGVVGVHGRGTPEFAGGARQRIIQTITLSKAFGVYGGAILGSVDLREKIFQRSVMFAGSTPLPPPLAQAAWQAVQLLARDRPLRLRLNHNIRYVKSALREKGFPVEDAPTPIIAFAPDSRKQAAVIRRRLWARKIFPSFIRYPGGPEEGYFRFALSSEHSRRQLDDLIRALTED